MMPVAAGRSEARVAAVFARVISDVLHQRGFPREVLLEGSDIPATHLDNVEARLARSQIDTLFERALSLTGDPCLGLSCGLDASEASFDLLGYVLTHAKTLQEVFGLISKFGQLMVDDGHVHCWVERDRAKVRIELPRGSRTFQRLFTDLSVAGLYRLLLRFGARADEIYSVSFAHTRPAGDADYQRMFGQLVRFSQPFSGVEFASELLERPHIHSNPTLHAVMCAQAERSLARISRPETIVDRVTAYIRAEPEGTMPSMEKLCRELGLSVRSLRRRLVEEGSSYRELKQRLLHEAALSMLRDSRRTVQDTAHALGFADVTAFHRAFKRWTQVTPAQYQRDTARLAGATSEPR